MTEATAVPPPSAWAERNDREERNNAYLGAALHWLRLRLRVLAEEIHGPPAPADARGGGWPPAVEPRLREEAALAAQALGRAAAAGDSAHQVLAGRLGLTVFEQDVLLLAAARDLDPSVDVLSAAAGTGGALPGPTFGLALRLFDEPAWEALSPARPLRRLSLVRLEGGGGLTAAPLRADERIVHYLKGLDHLDERLAETVVPLDVPDAGPALAPSQSETLDALHEWLRTAPSEGARPVNLVGPASVSKQLVARHLAALSGHSVVRVPVSALPVNGDAAALTVRLWEREAALSPLALYLDAGDEAGDHSPEAAALVGRLLARVPGPVFLDSRQTWPHLPPGAVVAEVADPTAAEQRVAWRAALGPAEEQLAGELAGQFALDPLALDRLAGRAVGEPAGERRARVWGACLAATRPRLDRLARRLDIRARREDLVLTPEIAYQLDLIRDQVRQRATVHEDWGVARRTTRGLGITALFSGESGTGKTTTAEALAGELALDLYRIDLSAVVDKYIGETEKNLRRLFDAAERGGAILFFDEADALFGRRSEVRDSHDRYANIEVNYLLQRMEAYRGLAVLATNARGALDQAFTRRLRFVLEFPFPGPQDRETIWRRAFGPGVATDLDHARLARFGLTGGSIHNIALNATFAAAAAGAACGDATITMSTVLPAVRAECRKLGLVVDERDFRRSDPNEPAEATR
ncbi:AAA family ATPase [Streptomyces pseudogriseolus]|uniref:AAA family ATPase n=1 Tax=Streptomyces pseudogriseolus TaxID=36817 RepID=UPI003FA1F7B4